MKLKPRIAAMTTIAVLLIGAISAAADDKPQPHALPKDGKTPVITLDSKGGMMRRVNHEPVLQVLADGTLLAGDPWGRGRKVEGKLSDEELQTLLRFILDEQKFRDIKLEDLRMNNGTVIMDAPTTNVTVEVDGVKKEVFGTAVETVAGKAGADSPASRFLAITRRLNQLTEITKLGGQAAFQKNLDAANAAIKAGHPGEEPVEAKDLQMAEALADGGTKAVFDHRMTLPTGKWHRLQVTVTQPAKGELKVSVARGSDQAG